MRFWAPILLLLLPLSLFAQRPGSAANPGVPGTSSTPLNVGVELQIKVTGPSDRLLTQPVRVQLTTRSGLPVADAITDSSSIATFHGIRPGSYRISATGIGINEATMDNVTVYRNDGTRLEYMRVTMRDPTQDALPGGTVAVQDLHIPEKARKQMDKAMEAFDKGDLPTALQWFEKAVATYPQMARAWNNIGVIRIRSGDKPGALDAWQKAVQADDRFAAPSFNIARAYITDRHPAQAESYIRKGLAAEPTSLEGMFLLETALAMQSQWEPTIELAAKIHASADHKRFPDTHRIAAEAYIQLGRTSEALKEFETYLQEQPDSPHAAQVRDTMAKLQQK